jgi:nickel transport system ATP-binding protein
MILEVKNLNVFTKKKENILKNINFSLKENMCLGILGESGSGKSMICKAIAGLLPDNCKYNGEIFFENTEILNLKDKKKRDLRGSQICMVIQNPMTAFNPLFTIENQMLETIFAHKKITKNEALDLITSSFEKMNLKDIDKILKKYPQQLSGGMLQRIMIALTISLNPKIIIADEPTTAIDVINQVEILKELKKIREEFKTTMIFISHDLSILNSICDEIIVVSQGKIIEHNSTNNIINNPQNEITKTLIDTRFKLINRFKKIVGDINDYC